MTLCLAPLAEALGAQVHGVDLAGPVAPDIAARLRAALAAHGVLVFPGQTLDAAAHARAAALFGPLHTEPGPDGAPRPRVRYVSNDADAPGPTILPQGPVAFHSDQCFAPAPYAATTLHALEAPERGGETLFASAVAAAAGLPGDLRAEIAGRRALHVYDGHRTDRPSGRVGDGEQACRHPCLVAHPATGTPVLYVNRLMTVAIEGLDRARSESVLTRLFAALDAPGLRYVHRWAPGDFVIWDNVATQHARSDFPPTTRRVLRRIAIAGVPLGAAS
jgi:taurine dioxygenase